MLALFLPFYFLLASVMNAKRLKVAVLGSGISGSRIYQKLTSQTSHKFDIAVFESGRNAGGRSSTRIHQIHSDKYCFDHGSQYISQPKSSEFKRLLSDWTQNDVVYPWKGNFGTWKDEILGSIPDSERLVPYPAMSELCRYMLSSCEVSYDTNVSAERITIGSGGQWRLSNTKTGISIGDWDVLISTDRSLVPIGCPKLQHDFVAPLQKYVGSSPCIALMVVFSAETSSLISQFPCVGLTLMGHSELSWIAQCSSKPGQERDDGKTCWVIHSTPSFAQQIIDDVKLKQLDFEQTRAAVTNASEKPLYSAFLRVISDQLGLTSQEIDSIHPVFIRAHRWGAAFPSKRGVLPGTIGEGCLERAGVAAAGLAAGKGLAYVDLEVHGFVAVGDYFSEAGSGEGRIEGACLSAQAGADAILSWVGASRALE